MFVSTPCIYKERFLFGVNVLHCDVRDLYLVQFLFIISSYNEET